MALHRPHPYRRITHLTLRRSGRARGAPSGQLAEQLLARLHDAGIDAAVEFAGTEQ